MLEKLDIYISIIAAIIVTIVSFRAGVAPNYMVTNIIYAILGFYVLGFIAKNYLIKTVFFEVEEEQDVLDLDENDEDEESEEGETMEDFSDILSDLKGVSKD